MDKLINILEDVNPEVNFETEQNLVSNGILDSFDIATLAAEISDEFDITIGAGNLEPGNFNSVEKMYAMIQRLGEQD